MSAETSGEIEADSLEDAEQKAFELFKENVPLYYFMDSIDENHSLTAGEFDNVDYESDEDKEDE
jgi:hypothetical protein